MKRLTLTAQYEIEDRHDENEFAEHMQDAIARIVYRGKRCLKHLNIEVERVTQESILSFEP